MAYKSEKVNDYILDEALLYICLQKCQVEVGIYVGFCNIFV